MSASDEPSKSFDQVITELEAVVKKLEQDELPLEEALEAYELGVRLHRQGFSKLADAERRIEELTERGPAPLDVEVSE